MYLVEIFFMQAKPTNTPEKLFRGHAILIDAFIYIKTEHFIINKLANINNL